MLPERTMVFAEMGLELDPYWWPYTSDGTSIELEDGEKVLVRSKSRVTIYSNPKAILPDTTTLLITNRRIAWVTRDFLKGGGQVGFTVTGVVLATALNAASKRKAAKRSAGKAAYGQIRYEWLDGLILRRKKALFGAVDYYVNLLVPCANGNERVELWSKSSGGSRTVDDNLARNLAISAIERRMELDPSLHDQCLEQLGRVRLGTSDSTSSLGAGEFGWAFPGKTERLIELAKPQRQSPDSAG
jgi:hypothetical protein